MILIKHTTSKVVLLFTIFHFLFTIQAIAQIPAGIDPNNLSSVKVDELSDNQIKMILNQGGAKGISIDQGIEMAKQRKLPANEIEKLKLRIININTPKTTTPALIDNPAAISKHKVKKRTRMSVN
jgi:regulatory protein YycI of two-component signal transduction system YycFG